MTTHLDTEVQLSFDPWALERCYLVADILPPPAYLVGPYLLCHRIAAEEDAEKRDELIGELEAATDVYRRRLRFWEGSLPDLDMVRSDVLRDYSTELRDQVREVMFSSLATQYEITIDEEAIGASALVVDTEGSNR